MTVEVNVVGMKCGAGSGGLSCSYCYQGAVRSVSHNSSTVVDHERVQDAVLRAAGPDGFAVFGGEPLLAARDDLERLWAFGLGEYGRNGVQTSGRPVTPWHLDAFERYRVHVGFSIDGPEELNDARIAGTLEQTRAATKHSEAMLRACLERKIPCSLIVTLHRLSASPERLPRLLDWLRSLDRAGLSSARIHLLELDGPARELRLSSDENVIALLALDMLERECSTLRLDVFGDLRTKLRDSDAAVTCVWNDCDPWTTPAVHGIEADGSRSLCQRVHKDGTQWLPADGPSRVRQEILWATPQTEGGCHGCRFFLQCGGQCPGTGIGGDWRKRTADCETWYAVLEHLEAELVAAGETPASLAPDLEGRVQARLAQRPQSSGHGDAHGDGHSDHTDSAGHDAAA